jgi:hypothetical protein
MGKPTASTSDRSNKPSPAERDRIAQIHKRQHCKLLRFWRQCDRDDCTQRQACRGNPFACFRRHFAAMPRDHADWRIAEVLSRTKGNVAPEDALRSAGLKMPDPNRPFVPPAPAAPPPQSEPAEPPRVIEGPPRDASRIATYVDPKRITPALSHAVASGRYAGHPDLVRPRNAPLTALEQQKLRLAELEEQREREGLESRLAVEERLRERGALAPGESLWSHGRRLQERSVTTDPKAGWPRGVWHKHRR